MRYRLIHLDGTADAAVPVALREANAQGVETRHDRNGRWTRGFEAETTPGCAQDLRLRNKGVYLITGGGGGLARIVAQFLAARGAARIALMGRSEMSGDMRKAFPELEACGAEIHYQCADVTNLDDIRGAVADLRERFGRINGVIHAAGVIDDARLRAKEPAAFARVLAPKIDGTLILDEALATEDLDFFVLFSSVSAVFGNAGQTDYATGNAFLDAFALGREERVRAGERFGKTLSINWPLWAKGGMRVSPETQHLAETSTGLTALATETGLRAFETALQAPGAQIIVTVGDQKRIARALGVQDAQKETPPVAALPEHAPEVVDDAALEERVAADLVTRVSRLLKVQTTDIDVEDDIGDYGFDSIAITSLVNEINASFELALTPVLFFENPSLEGLAQALVCRHRQAFQRFFAATTPVPELSPAAIPEDGPDAKPVSPVSGHGLEPHQYGEARAPGAERAGPDMEPVAIVGMAGRFPGSRNLDAFWQNLEAGKDLITEVPGDRWDWKALPKNTGPGQI